MVKMFVGKIIVANFTNQSGLKQIGNSTFIETAASGKVELDRRQRMVSNVSGFGALMLILQN